MEHLCASSPANAKMAELDRWLPSASPDRKLPTDPRRFCPSVPSGETGCRVPFPLCLSPTPPLFPDWIREPSSVCPCLRRCRLLKWHVRRSATPPDRRLSASPLNGALQLGVPGPMPTPVLRDGGRACARRRALNRTEWFALTSGTFSLF